MLSARLRRLTLALIAGFVVIVFSAGWARPARAATPSADLVTTIDPVGLRVVGRYYPEIMFGSYVGFNVHVTNDGPDPADAVVVNDNWYAGIFRSVAATAPVGVSCTAPPAGSRVGTVACTTASLGPGTSMTIRVVVRASWLPHSLLQDKATATSATPDPNAGNSTAWTAAEIM